ncbi:hypothetical protein [Spartinivicinus ruber]|uniref:hypothetical protein n=1 Tax=Spartinivicinus ruber TaxID=2683272 RepID=UPI0013D3B6E3|nr:hypothetical protein [Spartinivicinus ruber]
MYMFSIFRKECAFMLGMLLCLTIVQVTAQEANRGITPSILMEANHGIAPSILSDKPCKLDPNVTVALRTSCTDDCDENCGGSCVNECYASCDCGNCPLGQGVCCGFPATGCSSWSCP